MFEFMAPLFAVKILVMVLGGLTCLILAGLFVWENIIKAGRRIRMSEMDALLAKYNAKPSVNPSPSSFATNYLLNEGFLLVIRKPDQELKLCASVGNERILTCFSVDRSHGTPILINNATNERIAVDAEFIKRWVTTNYTEL